MKNVNKMTQEQLSSEMEGLIKRFRKFEEKGVHYNKLRFDSAERFEELKEIFVELGWWILFCSFFDLDPNVDGYDLINGDGEL